MTAPGPQSSVHRSRTVRAETLQHQRTPWLPQTVTTTADAVSYRGPGWGCQRILRAASAPVSRVGGVQVVKGSSPATGVRSFGLELLAAHVYVAVCHEPAQRLVQRVERGVPRDVTEHLLRPGRACRNTAEDVLT